LPLLGVRIPKVRIVHLTTDQLRSGGSESRWRLAGPVLDRLEAHSFARMDRIYVVNEEATELLRRRLPRLADRIGFVPNWVDDTIFHSLADDRRAAVRNGLLARLGLPSSTRLVLFAGRLERQKDPGLLIDAFARLRQRDPDAALLVVGSGGLRAEIERRVADRGIEQRVRLLEPVSREELAQLMNAADCMAITSAFETGPTVAYEALACGLPVIATAVGQIPRLVRQGVNGDVIEGRDPQALADALRGVLELPTNAARAASVIAAAPFRASAVLGQLYEDHRQLAADRAS
jgi:glycosyltransferase involved in cell wall biosynthesis